MSYRVIKYKNYFLDIAMALRKHQEQLEHDTEYDRLLLDGEPFAGTLIPTPTDPDRWEEEYRNGLPHGWYRLWWRSGHLRSLRHHKWGWMHGSYQNWYENGQIEEESEYELAICKRRKRWDEEGNLVEDYVLHGNSRDHESLLAMRKAYYGHTGEERGDEE
ncbi:Hypothetical protein PBC10988_26230 [Planctomycetales bacterium 10988]|nr:Hypothetical protein PBC10988_26230 [Planctomycetales bacterium 10988]